MGYHAVDDELIECMSAELLEARDLLIEYRKARDEVHRLSLEFSLANKKFQELRKKVSDSLLRASEGISRVEHHHEGEAW